ncbi:MAG TPA: MFS transporter [Anaeromyxobacter sp.]|nr:MFS transporter [Anaeromyxobacter sp.]
MDATSAAERKKWAVLAAVGVGTFMSALDGSIVNTLLPRIGAALGATVAQTQWIVVVYLLVVSGLLLVVGRLGDTRGHKDVYVVGFAGFVVSSALCGLSPSLPWLVGFRALQALSAAMLFANAPAILTASFPPQERGRALGLQAVMTYLGLSVGPPLGGLLATHLGWPSIFYVNVPVGAVGLWLSHRNIARDRPAGPPPRFDVLGAGLFFVGLLSLLLALNQGHAWGWASPPVAGLLAVAAAGLAAFVRVERRRAAPMLDLALFGSRVFSGAVFSAMLSYVAQFAVLFLLPYYLRHRGLRADVAGLVLTSQPVVMMITAPFAGSLSDRIGTRGPVVVGLLVLAGGLLLLSTVGPATPWGFVVLAMAVCGVGFGCFVAPNNSRLLGAAPPNRRGIASGVLAGARNVGMVLGVGLAGAVYTTVLARRGEGAVVDGVAISLQVVAGLTLLAAVTSWLEGKGTGPAAPRTGPQG